MVVDEVPERITTAGLTEVTKKLAGTGLPLANPVVHEDRLGPADILIGNDYYYDFISGHIVSQGVHLLKSPLGYMITEKFLTFMKMQSCLAHHKQSFQSLS